MKIFIIGDSISIHYGPYLKTFLQGIMEYSRKEGEDEALLNLDNPQGANGGDSSMVLNFLESKINSGGIDADLIMVNCGLHDIKKYHEKETCQISIDDYASNLKEIVKTVAKLNKKMVWVRTTPCDENIHNEKSKTFHRFEADCESYNEVADNIMKNNEISSIDLNTFTNNLGTDLYCDHIHFKESVREKQAAFIAGFLSDKSILHKHIK